MRCVYLTSFLLIDDFWNNAFTLFTDNYLPPLQKRTAFEELWPDAFTSSTHSLNIFDSCFKEQKLKAIAARAIAEMRLEPS